MVWWVLTRTRGWAEGLGQLLLSPLGLGLPLDPLFSTGVPFIGRLMAAEGDLLFPLSAESVTSALSVFLFRPFEGSLGDAMADDAAAVLRSSLVGPLGGSTAFFCAITKSS